MKRILSISLLLIFIAGQVNLTWADHYCMNFKVQSSVMIGHGELDCGMGEMMECDENKNNIHGPVYEAPNCCSNDYFSSDSDDEFNKSETLSAQQVSFLTVYAEAILSFTSENKQQTTFTVCSPPLIQADKQVMYQTFLL